MVWVCRKHGKDCFGFVQDIANRLNQAKVFPGELDLVEWVPPRKLRSGE